MVTVEDFSRLVAGIYTAAAAPGHWEQSLRDMHRTLGGIAGALCVPNGAVWSIEDSNLPPNAARDYAEHYCRIDHVLDAVQSGGVGVVRTGVELIDTHTEFYVDWMRPNRLEDGLLVRLTAGCRPTCLVISSPRRGEPFATPERLSLFGCLVPHLRQAMLVRDRLTTQGNTMADLATALDLVRYGIVVMAAERFVLKQNSAAERILGAGDGLSVIAGRLCVQNAGYAQRFDAALATAVYGDTAGVRAGWSSTCARPSGKRPYVVHLVPSHRWESDGPPRRATAILIIVDPDDRPEPAPALLRRVYHLTIAEAEVALHIMHGEDLKQVSSLLSVSLATVRTHLQHVFDKTDTHRQAELVHLLHIVDPGGTPPSLPRPTANTTGG